MCYGSVRTANQSNSHLPRQTLNLHMGFCVLLNDAYRLNGRPVFGGKHKTFNRYASFSRITPPTPQMIRASLPPQTGNNAPLAGAGNHLPFGGVNEFAGNLLLRVVFTQLHSLDPLLTPSTSKCQWCCVHGGLPLILCDCSVTVVVCVSFTAHRIASSASQWKSLSENWSKQRACLKMTLSSNKVCHLV